MVKEIRLTNVFVRRTAMLRANASHVNVGQRIIKGDNEYITMGILETFLENPLGSNLLFNLNPCAARS